MCFCIFVIEENIKELARFAKNYLPILFNIYTACEEKNDSVSLPILQTLKCYLQITDQQVRIYLGPCYKRHFLLQLTTTGPSRISNGGTICSVLFPIVI